MLYSTKIFISLFYQSNNNNSTQKLNKMKKQSTTTVFTNLSSEQVTALTTIVAETLASVVPTVKTKVFTAADLWNIQRNKRVITSRRFSF